MITWQQVVTSPRFQKLSEPEKRKVQQSFFDQYVAPVAAENGYDLEQVGKQFNERATSLWYTPPEPVEVNNAFEPAADSGSTSAPSAPKRTWTEAATDLPKDVAAGTLEMAAGVAGLGRRLLAMREDRNNQAMREEYGTTTPLATSALVESKPGAFEAAAKGTADVIREGQSDKRQWQRQQLQDAPGALEAASFLISNPTALVSLAAESATSMFAAGGLGGALAKGASMAGASQAATSTLAKIGAMVGEGALSAGTLGNDIEDLLNKQGITDPALRKSAIDIANTAGVVTGYLGRIGAGVEVMPFMRESIKESLLKAIPKAMSKEAAEEFVQSYSETVAKNLALGQAGATDESGKAITNLTQDATKQGVIGAMAGAASGGAMPVISSGLDRLQPTNPIPGETGQPDQIPPLAPTPNTPPVLTPQAAAQEILSQPSASTVPLTGDLKADLDAINNAPVTPLESLAAAFKTAKLNPIGVENATQPIPVPTPAGRTQADNLVNAGNNDLARVDIAPTGILAQAPAVEGNPLPPNQTQAGQAAQGATDNARPLESASQNQPIANSFNDGAFQAILPENAQPAQGLDEKQKNTTKEKFKSDIVAIAEKARLQAAQDGAAAFESGAERQLPEKYASRFSSPAGQARGKAWFQGWDQANAEKLAGERNVAAGNAGANPVAVDGAETKTNGTPSVTPSVTQSVEQTSNVAGRQDVSDSPAAAVQPQVRDYQTKTGIKQFDNKGKAQEYLEKNLPLTKGGKNSLVGFKPRQDGKKWVLSKVVKPKSEAQLKAQAQQKIDSVTPYPARDNLWTAIAKLGGLNKKEAVSTWDSDPRQYRASHVWNRPVLSAVYVDKDDQQRGLSLDDMGQKLAELGYLPKDENGKYDLADFEEAFKNGDEHYTPAGFERRAQLSEEAQLAEREARLRQLDEEAEREGGLYTLSEEEQNLVLAWLETFTNDDLASVYGQDAIDELRAEEERAAREREDEINAIAEREGEAVEARPQEEPRGAEETQPEGAASGAEARTNESRSDEGQVEPPPTEAAPEAPQTPADAGVFVSAPITPESGDTPETPADAGEATTEPRIPLIYLQNTMVKARVFDEDSRAFIEEEVTAKEAIAAYEEDIETLERVKLCVGGQ
ncbi:MAG: hypothetical protein ING61_05785 [Rhodocyclaceae bacterium]|nr:hypothetical protein [Rhodocyclaceae bacterium]